MGEEPPLRFGGGGVRAFGAPMVAGVASVFVYSYRVAGPADSRYPKHSLVGVGLPSRQTHSRSWAPGSTHTQLCVAKMGGSFARGGRSRKEGLGAGAEGSGDAFPGALSVGASVDRH